MIRQGNSIVWSKDIEKKMLEQIAEDTKCPCGGDFLCSNCQYRLTMFLLSVED